MTGWFELNARGSNAIDLAHFRTTSDASVIHLIVSTSGHLGLRDDVSGVTLHNPTPVTMHVWHRFELHAVISGTASYLEVWLDGQPATTLSGAMALGSQPLGVVQIGDNHTGRTFDVIFDDLTVSTVSAPAATSISLSTTATRVANSRNETSTGLRWRETSTHLRGVASRF
ncbi:MAG TPA: hypothetical protein VIO62_04675 [Candidatus Dormibacteraeota bacterium]|jgi:hypothetical protein